MPVSDKWTNYALYLLVDQNVRHPYPLELLIEGTVPPSQLGSGLVTSLFPPLSTKKAIFKDGAS